MLKNDEKQKKRLTRMERFSKGGLAAQFIEINELAEAFEELQNAFDTAIRTVSGKDGKDGKTIVGPRGPIGEVGREGKQGMIGPKGDNGNDGKTGLIGPAGKDGTNGSPDTAEDIRNKLELLSGDERLDAKYIRGLADHIKTYNKETNDDILMRATAILDQRTSFLINKLSNLQNQVNAIPIYSGSIPFPQMSTATRLSLSPTNGQTAFDTDIGVAMIYINGYWGTVQLT